MIRLIIILLSTACSLNRKHCGFLLSCIDLSRCLGEQEHKLQANFPQLCQVLARLKNVCIGNHMISSAIWNKQAQLSFEKHQVKKKN